MCDYEVSPDAANHALFQTALDALGVEEGGAPFILVGDWEGCLLKLLLGMMMLEPGVQLLVAPEWVSRLGVALALLALGVTWIYSRQIASARRSGLSPTYGR